MVTPRPRCLAGAEPESGECRRAGSRGSLTTSVRPTRRESAQKKGRPDHTRSIWCRKKNAAAVCGVCSGSGLWPDPETLENETALCWEEDLDASVLRLAHTWRRRHAQIVEAVTDNGHVAARDTQSGKTARHGIRPPLGEPLVVAE